MANVRRALPNKRPLAGFRHSMPIFAIAVYSLMSSLLGTARPCEVGLTRLVFKAPVWYRCVLFARQAIYV